MRQLHIAKIPKPRPVHAQTRQGNAEQKNMASGSIVGRLTSRLSKPGHSPGNRGPMRRVFKVRDQLGLFLPGRGLSHFVVKRKVSECQTTRRVALGGACELPLWHESSILRKQVDYYLTHSSSEVLLN